MTQFEVEKILIQGTILSGTKVFEDDCFQVKKNIHFD